MVDGSSYFFYFDLPCGSNVSAHRLLVFLVISKFSISPLASFFLRLGRLISLLKFHFIIRILTDKPILPLRF